MQCLHKSSHDVIESRACTLHPFAVMAISQEIRGAPGPWSHRRGGGGAPSSAASVSACSAVLEPDGASASAPRQRRGGPDDVWVLAAPSSTPHVPPALADARPSHSGDRRPCACCPSRVAAPPARPSRGKAAHAVPWRRGPAVPTLLTVI